MTGPENGLGLTPQMPRAQALRRLAEALAGAGVEPARREARLLLLAALDLPAAALIGDENEPLGTNASRLARFAARRLAREPFARIVGRREFHGHDFVLSPATLVPRPDTETLVDAVLAEANARATARLKAPGQPLVIADLGTGSGAILAALLHALPGALGVAIDRSAEALATARTNIEAIAGPGRTRYLENNWLSGLSLAADIIVSNPPYIPSAAIAGLEPEVAFGDPRLALDGGADGLHAYRLIADQSGAALASGGFVAVEIGAGQGPEVSAIFAAAGFVASTACKALGGYVDLGGHLRALVFNR